MSIDNFEVRHHLALSETPPLEQRVPQEVHHALLQLGTLIVGFRQETLGEIEALRQKRPQLESDLKTYGERLGQLEYELDVIKQVTEIVGIKLPEEGQELSQQTETEDELTLAWQRKSKKKVDAEEGLKDTMQQIEKVPVLEALRTILENQGGIVASLINQWRENPEELIEVARNLKVATKAPVSGEKGCSRFEHIRLAVLGILQEGPIVKAKLREKLLSEEFSLEPINTALRVLLEGDEEIEAGWCAHSRGVTKFNRAGHVYKLKTTELPNGTVFFSGLTKVEAQKRIKEDILKVLQSAGRELTVDEVYEMFENINNYALPRSSLYSYLGWFANIGILTASSRRGRSGKPIGYRIAPQSPESSQ